MLYVYFFKNGKVAESPKKLTVYDLSVLEALNGSCYFIKTYNFA